MIVTPESIQGKDLSTNVFVYLIRNEPLHDFK